jgi:hypothetical protein
LKLRFSTLLLAGAAVTAASLASCGDHDEPPGEVACQVKPSETFHQRIEPLLSEDRVTTCNQCHLSGVDLKAWQPAEEKNEAFYAKVPMKLELGGKFHQIAKFAYEMGKVERIINLENIELTDPKVEGDEIKLKVKCLATSFRLRAKPAADAISRSTRPRINCNRAAWNEMATAPT